MAGQKAKFGESKFMAFTIADLEDQSRFRLLLKIPYDEMVTFVLDYLKRKSSLIVFFWSINIIFLAIALIVRINISGYFHFRNIFLHSMLGFVVFPLLCIPVHELLHIIPYYLTGARNIKFAMDSKQFMFYVSAHRQVVSSKQFKFVALVPFVLISITMLFLILYLPGLWKWSLSLFLFVHSTMCAGDFALLNLYALNKKGKIYTWDDLDEKMAYFYEEI